MTRSSSRACRAALFAATLFLSLTSLRPAPARAQSGGVLGDSTLFFIDPRPEDDIKHDQDAAAAAQARAEATVQRASLQKSRAEADVKLKEAEIKVIGTDIDAADQARDDARKKDLELKRKQAETEKDFLDRKREMRDDEVKWAKADAEAAQSAGRFYELERDLCRKRDERGGYAGQALSASVQSSVVRLDGEVRSLERKALEARLQLADKQSQAADAAQELFKVRRSLLDAMDKVAKGAK